MTCIVALVGEQTAVMGADRQIVDGWIKHEAGAPKIARVGQWLLGSTGPIRVNNAIKHVFDPPKPPVEITEWWIVTAFVPALRAAMVTTETAVIEGWLGGKEGEQQGTVLCACPGAIFTVQADWAVDLWQERYAVIGTGQRYALGALHAVTRISPPATVYERVRAVEIAVEAAGAFDIYCGTQADTLISERARS